MSMLVTNWNQKFLQKVNQLLFNKTILYKKELDKSSNFISILLIIKNFHNGYNFYVIVLSIT